MKHSVFKVQYFYSRCSLQMTSKVIMFFWNGTQVSSLTAHTQCGMQYLNTLVSMKQPTLLLISIPYRISLSLSRSF
jgi:hypothetical protein